MKTLVLITSPPGSAEAWRGMDLVKTLREHGRAAGLALLQDAVLIALARSTTPTAGAVHELIAQELPIYVSEHDLGLRGFSPTDVTPGVHLADDRQIVDLMLVDDTRSLGCF